MRQGSNNQSNRRGRGRGHNHNHGRRNNHGGNRNQNYDSNGPQGRIRGNAKQVYEKYLQLAKDAISAGDRVLAESLYQHADHYGRIAAQFAPKPKPEDEVEADQNDAGSEGGDDSADEAETVSVEIQDGDESSEETPAEEAVEEKPKRRAPRRAAPRKKAVADDEKPKLGGGTNAVPDFLARPVDVEPEASKETAADDEEKPKRRTRKTTSTTTRKAAAPKTTKTTTTRTRRKKADADGEAGETKEESKEAV